MHNNLGLLYYDRGNCQEARDHHMKAVELINESHSKWVEFKRNFDRANQRCQHLANKKKEDTMHTLINDESTQ